MKRIFTLLCAAMLAGQAWADDNFKVGDLYYSTWFGDAYVECENSADNYANNYSGLTTVTIPDKVEYDGDEYPVVGISREAFKNCTSLTTITFPNSLQQIGGSAFEGCSNLTSVEIPNTVTRISESAFVNCTSLESVTLPNSITEISSAIFGGCTSLTTIELPNTVTFIGNAAFSESGLTEIVIPSSVTEISSFAFQDCKDLTTITIPASVKTIGSYAFKGCKNLTINCCIMSIPSGWSTYWNYDNRPYNLGNCGGEQTWTVTVYANNSAYGSVSGGGTYANGSTVTITATPADDYTFVKWSNGLTNATETITVTSDTTIVAEFAKIVYAGTCGDDARWSFSVASKTLTISGTGSIDRYKTVDLFSTEVDRPWQEIADQIEKVVIGEGITNLGSYAFCYLNNLKEVNISSTCNSYGSMSFANCPNLKKLVVTANNIYQANEYCFSNFETCTVYVPADRVDYYKKDIIFGMFKNIVGGYLVTIDADFKCGTVEVESYFVPEGGTLKITTKPNEGYRVTDVKFEGTRGILHIYGDYIYSVDDVRSNIVVKVEFSREGDEESGFIYKVISGNNIEITKYKGTGGNVTIPSTITDNGVEYTVTSIGDRAFDGNSDVKSVTISNTVTNIGESAFSYLDLTSLTVPNSVKTIGDYAFSYVKNVVYNGSASGNPWGALTINGIVDGNCIFADAEKTHLTAYITNHNKDEKIDIPESVITIGENAFDYTWATQYGDAYYFGNEENPYLILWHLANYFNDSVITSYEIKDGCKYIYYTAFANMQDLESVTIPNSVISIGKLAFFGCDNLKSVNIPDGVVAIGEGAFSNCYGLSSITIPKSVTTIDKYAFGDCDNLTITCEVSSKPEGWDNEWNSPSSTVNWAEIDVAVIESAANAVNIYAHGNTIVIENATDEICVYDAMGRLVARAGRDVARNVFATEIRVNGAGVYIVKVGTVVKRVVVND